MERENCPEDGDVPDQHEAGDGEHEAQDQDDVLFGFAVGVGLKDQEAQLSTSRARVPPLFLY